MGEDILKLAKQTVAAKKMRAFSPEHEELPLVPLATPYRIYIPWLIDVSQKMEMEMEIRQNWSKNTQEFTRSAFMSHILSRLTVFESMWDPHGFFTEMAEYLGVTESSIAMQASQLPQSSQGDTASTAGIICDLQSNDLFLCALGDTESSKAFQTNGLPLFAQGSYDEFDSMHQI